MVSYLILTGIVLIVLGTLSLLHCYMFPDNYPRKLRLYRRIFWLILIAGVLLTVILIITIPAARPHWQG